MHEWPVVRRYRGNELARLAMPVGGIGTGTISLGGRGQLLDWELFNQPAKGHSPDSFFCVRLEGDGRVQTRVLEGALHGSEYEGPFGSPSALHGLPRFRHAEFAAAYPLGQVLLSDPEVALEATLRVFNPLLPGDAEASGIPVLMYGVCLRNVGPRPLSVSVAGNLRHVVGHLPGQDAPSGNVFVRRQAHDATMLFGTSQQLAADHPAQGTVALAVLGAPVSSHRLNWAKRSWGDSLLEFWDDFRADGRVEEPTEGARVPTGTLVVSADLAPGEETQLDFAVAWHFPNRRAWNADGPLVGNHYTTRFADAAAVVEYVAAQRADLESQTVDYVRTVTSSDLPPTVQDAVLSNVSVLKSTTCFRAADGTFLAWEGSNPDHGSCHGSCTHVWNYQYALEQLFPDLAWSMREVEFVHALDDLGLMSFRVGLPLETNGREWRTAAADGQMGALVRLHRTWSLTGDTERLRRLWPGARRALEFAWVPGGWDADEDGVMEGCQHNTMDVEYYGPSGVNQSWYLAALAAMAEMCAAVGDDADFVQRCQGLLAAGAVWTDANLFNGDYYEHRVIAPGSADAIADGLRIRYEGDSPDMGSDDLVDPDLQIGPGCTTDQLVGQTMAALGGLDTMLDRGHVRTALASVVAHNHRDHFHDHFNHLRSYALGDDRGLLNCTWPRGDRPTRPFPYCNEVWSGLEYTAAVGLAVEGERETAGRIVADVRTRHTGETRNPFNEVECGNHYARSLASFGLVHGWSHLVVDARAATVTVDAVPGRWPVVAGHRLGHVVVADGSASYEALAGSGFDVVVRNRYLRSR
jgi:non-lysosomal glucosylceramidase